MCRWGAVYLYVEGAPVEKSKAKARPPAGREDTDTVWHEVVLRAGEQYITYPETLEPPAANRYRSAKSRGDRV